MTRRLLLLEMLGIPCVVAMGTALHFVCAWSGYWTPIAVVAPVNESVWEHFKLAFWPGVFWALVEYAAHRRDAWAFWSAKGYSLCVAPILIAGLFYGYTALLGRNILAIDIGTFVVGVVFAQFASAYLINADIQTARRLRVGIGLLLCQLTVYATFTFYPPPLGLFEDGRNGTRGIAVQTGDRSNLSSH